MMYLTAFLLENPKICSFFHSFSHTAKNIPAAPVYGKKKTSGTLGALRFGSEGFFSFSFIYFLVKN